MTVLVNYRQGQEDAQKVLFDKANLVGLLAEHFISYDYPIPPKDSDAYDLTLKRSLARGIIVNCGNATRLQSSLQSPNSFLSRFLHKNDQWKTFVEDLLVS